MRNNDDMDLRPHMSRLDSGSGQQGECSGDFLIATCVEGDAVLCGESARHRCARGDVALIPGNEVYRFLPEGESAWIAVWRLSAGTLNRLKGRECDAAHRLIELTAHSRVLRWKGEGQERLDWLIREYLLDGSAEAPYADCCRMAAMELLLIELCRMLGGGADGEREDRGETERSQLIKNVIAYINEHYQEDIGLNSLARQFWVSPSYLSRQFKSKVGINITRFITQRRLQAAQRLLITSDLDISEISSRLGFKSGNYFYTVFKKSCGISPREYRRRDRISDTLLNHHRETGE